MTPGQASERSGDWGAEVFKCPECRSLEAQIVELREALVFVREKMPNPDVGDSHAIRAEMRCFERIDAALQVESRDEEKRAGTA